MDNHFCESLSLNTKSTSNNNNNINESQIKKIDKLFEYIPVSHGTASANGGDYSILISISIPCYALKDL